MAIGSNFTRRTPATLADLARQYLNQGLPDISGIFTLPQTSNIITPIVEEEAVAAPGLTPEQLALLYPQDPGSGDDRPRTGFGLFDNLDKSDVRYEVVNGELIPTYRNVTSGLYQTEQGKNVSNLGLSTPTFAFLEGIFGAKTPPEFPGYFQQDPVKRGSFLDFITGKTRKDAVRTFLAEQRADTGIEDPSDYLQRKRREEQESQRRILQNINAGGGQDNKSSGGGGGGPSYSGMSSIGSGGVSQRDAGPGYDDVSEAGSF